MSDERWPSWRPVANIHICSFSGAAAELIKGHRTPDDILSALKVNPRVSTFDMSEIRWLRERIAFLEKDGLIVSVSEPYPWHRYEITELGMTRLTSTKREA